MQRLIRTVNGVFAVYKPANITSATVLTLIRKGIIRDLDAPSQFSKDIKLGHGGVLDINATGVLAVGIGNGCKYLTQLLKGSKKYRCTGCLGTATDTYNSDGHVKRQDLISLTKNNFTGDILQVPPVYSALKFHGKRLSDLARSGRKLPDMKARLVKVYDIQVLDFHPPYFHLEIECGAGCYIRSIVHDIGTGLDTCAHVTALERTKHGPFTLEDALLPEDWTLVNIKNAVRSAERKFGQNVNEEKFT